METKTSKKSPEVDDIWYYWLHMAPRKKTKGRYMAAYKALTDYLRIFARLLRRQRRKTNASHFDLNAKLIVATKSDNHHAVYESLRDKLDVTKTYLFKKTDFGLWPEFRQESVPRSRMASALFKIVRYDFKAGLNSLAETPGRNKLFDVYLQYFQVLSLLKKSNARAIILFNDHMPLFRAIRFASEQARIKTIYIPHASVSSRFPELNFDISLLESEVMRDTYDAATQHRDKVYVIGNLKIASHRQAKANSEHSAIVPRGIKIGLAFNSLDAVEKVETIVEGLLDAFLLNQDLCSAKIVVRKHPADKRRLGVTNERLSLSEAETSLQFLSELDLLLVSNSNIALEALLLNIPVIHYRTAESELDDNYGFVKNGLLEAPVQDVSCLIQKIKKTIRKDRRIEPSAEKALSRYDAGRSAERPGQPIESAIAIINSCLKSMEELGNG